MMLAVFVNTFGSGVFLPLSALYFTQVVGLSVGEVAFALGTASLAGMFSGLPLGRLADRVGPREVQIALVGGMGLGALGYLLVQSVWQLLVVVTFIRVLDRGVAAVAGALVAGSTVGPQRAQARAYLRVMLNLGMSLGAGLAILALQIGTPTAFRAVIVFDAATYFATALLYLRIPRVPPTRERREKHWGTLRDRRYLAFTAGMSVLTINNAVLTIGLPLWVADHLEVPHGLIGLAFLVNTVGVVLLLVPVSSRVNSISSAGRALRVAGVAMFLACALFAVAHGRPVWLASTLVLVGVLGHLAGELYASSAQFYLGFELADDTAQGEYQGLMSTGSSLAAAAGPATMAVLPLALGGVGWLVLGLVFVAAALGTAAVAKTA
jgi:MFS family permease